MILSVALGVIAVGCSEDAPQSPVPDAPGTLTIRFSNSDMSRSGASDVSETKLESITIALYPDGSQEDIAPVAVETFPNPAGNAGHDAVITMYLTEDMVAQLFGGINVKKCRFFAVANVPVSDIPDKPTIAQLKNITVTSDFMTVPVQKSFVMAGPGEVAYAASTTGGVGSASGEGTLNRAAAKINLNVKLPASITVKNSAGVEETWSPVTAEGNIIVYINNGVQSAVAYPVAPVGGTPWKPASADAYYNSDPTTPITYRSPKYNGIVQEEETKINEDGTTTTTQVTLSQFRTDVPFYTYPNAWSVNDLKDTGQTTLTLIVRWRKGEEQQWTQYYYQVPVTPTDIHQIDSNHSYSINLKVGMLGSLVPETPLTVEDCTYQIVNWNQENINIDIKDYRYLVVNPNSISVQNEADIIVPFYSSHPVDPSNVTMTFQRFNFYLNGNGEVVDITVPQTVLDASVTNGQKMCTFELTTDPATNQNVIKINHPLEIWDAYNGNTPVTFTDKGNTVTPESVAESITNFRRPANPEAPYSSYVFKIHIAHKDNPAYAEDITITQYPAMYIEAKRNPGGGADPYPGNVIVNNSSTSLGNVYNLGAATNRNPNMYVINISQLEISSKYVIGDPRMEYTNNNLSTSTGGKNPNYPDLPTATSDGAEAGNWCNRAGFIYGTADSNTGTPGMRRLTYYYPTIESQEDQYKMRIGPKIRVASSYGVTQPLNRDDARRRVATYQEVNCPAGRWRLPTYGELQFIVKLSQEGKIPVLFNSGSTYWTAQGACTVNRNGTLTLSTNTNTTCYVRGVYDEWYWELYPQYSITPTGTDYTYTLGDVLRGK